VADSGERTIIISTGLLSGIFAGALTLLLPGLSSAFYTHTGLPFIDNGSLLGDIFGAVMTAYFCLVLRKRLVARSLAFIFGCAVAWNLGLYTTMFTATAIGFPTPESYGNAAATPMAAFVVGGSVGGLAVLFSALVCFYERTRFSQILLKSLQWAVVGGILGALGWALGPFLGRAALTVLGRQGVLSSPSDAGTDYFWSIILVWQAGMGLLIGFLFRDARSEDGQPAIASVIAGSGYQNRS
jgi:hypothetical protein